MSAARASSSSARPGRGRSPGRAPPPAARWRRARRASSTPATIAATSACVGQVVADHASAWRSGRSWSASARRVRAARRGPAPSSARARRSSSKPLWAKKARGEVELEVGAARRSRRSGSKMNPRRPVEVERAAAARAGNRRGPSGLLGVGQRVRRSATSQIPTGKGWSWRFGADGRGRRPRDRRRSRGSFAGSPIARQHQQLRRADRAGGEDRPRARARATAIGVLPASLTPRRASAARSRARARSRAVSDRQVRPCRRAAAGRRRRRSSADRASASSRRAVPFGVAVVVVGVEREAALRAGLDHQVGELARAARRGDVERPTDAVGRRGAGLVVLGAHEVGENVVPPRPLAAGVVAPAVVVVA